MDVINLGVRPQSKYQVNDGSLFTTKGEISQITIKERISDNEAKVVFKGQQVEVKFDGPVPVQDRVFVEVAKLDENGQLVVKPIVNSTLGKQVDTLLANAGFDPVTHKELREAVKQILTAGGNVSKDSLVHLDDFLRNSSGTLAEKLETIKVIHQKNIEFTKVQLNAVNMALHGDDLSETLFELVEGKTVNQPKNMKNLDLASNMQKSLQPGVERLHQALSNVDESTDILQKEPILNTALSLIQKEEIPKEMKAPIEETMKGTLLQGFTGDSKNLVNDNKKITEALPQNPYVLNDSIQSAPIDSKTVMVTEIPKKLAQMAIDFKQVKQDISRNLEATSSLIQTKNTVPAQQILEATIHNLDKAILKSNFMLYADMDTEKKMLIASSKLAEAKNLIIKGNLTEANQIVKQVSTELEKLTFNPLDTKIKHFVLEEESLSPKLFLEKTLQPAESGRGVFEKVKALGLTHEVDVARAITEKQEIPHSLKSVLLQIAEDGKVTQALSSITGQQLVNKQDSTGIQNLLLQLPILLNKQVENVKVYVNSHKKGEKIDWENCSLYFVLETKKLGAVGIQISAVNRNLSITFKSDQKSIPEVVKPLTEVTKEQLQQIGYHVGTFQFKPFTEEKKLPEEKSPKQTEKGFDISI
ncbi:MAG TPA: hypothetical protein VJ546_07120 [Bacillales bacterium]|nr:hypothetical protein [Bacillales bacterium]